MSTLLDILRSTVSTDEEAREILAIVDRGEGSIRQEGESLIAWRRFPERIHVMSYAGRLEDFPRCCAHIARDMAETGIENVTWDGRPAWSRIAERFRHG